MKNLHLLPTPNPSRGLVFFNGSYRIEKRLNNYPKNIYPSSQGYNIYITSDEEITGTEDWYLWGDKIYKNKKGDTPKSFCKKIILTTDQDLIKDGVQVIPDEFLEWFVKNPTCEEIGINKLLVGKDIPKINFTYKIIIPKEELLDSNPQGNKQARLIKELANSLSSKQETLEEAAENFGNIYYGEYTDITSHMTYAFKAGAKWQQERSYSEEEVLEILYKVGGWTMPDVKEWFEKYKKK